MEYCGWGFEPSVPALHFGAEEPANQRNLTGVSPELMFEWVIVMSGLIIYPIPGG